MANDDVQSWQTLPFLRAIVLVSLALVQPTVREAGQCRWCGGGGFPCITAMQGCM